MSQTCIYSAFYEKLWCDLVEDYARKEVTMKTGKYTYVCTSCFSWLFFSD